MDAYYLDMEDVLSLHNRQLEQFGGAPGIRDAGLIEAALARPQSGYYNDRSRRRPHCGKA
jgi:death-on-curing protein